MDFQAKTKALRSNFPVFQQFELIETIAQNSRYVEVPKGTVILNVGDYIKVIPLVVSGSVKVFREDDDAREAFLYYIKPGQSCAMTLASSIKQGKSEIKAVALENTGLMALSADSLYSVNKKYPSWYNFVFETFGMRFNELIQAFEGVIFHHLDERLMRYLQQRSATVGSTMLKISHNEIARDLATSREVISRLLKQFEKEKLVLLARGQITLL
ncbi:MAG TPA: Crp/Fnr family transcriptional regulator [Saprospiraceae bacterium]|nr:Crp/Fnr family transcriptional regulator [Saprospiraceae bacterium]